MKRFIEQLTVSRHRGQSLVEVAIFLPIIILLLGGVVEVSNLLVTQNRVSTAARVATGFGATHFEKDHDWSQIDAQTGKPGWASAMATTALNNVTETLDLSPQRWDIWTITATVSVNEGTGVASFDHWYGEHAYGDGVVVSDAEWAGMEGGVQADVVDALNEIITDTLSNDGLGIIATVAYHDRESVLGLNAFDIGSVNRIRGLTVMRIQDDISTFADSGACTLLPIAIQYEQYSLYPTNWYAGDAEADAWYETTDGGVAPVPSSLRRLRLNPAGSFPEDPAHDWPGDPATRYPATDCKDLDIPGCAEVESPQNKWLQDAGIQEDEWYLDYMLPSSSTDTYNSDIVTNFNDNWPGVPLADGSVRLAERGFIYRARQVEGKGGFGWLDWDGISASQTDLKTSLAYPGDYNLIYPDSPPDEDPLTGNGNDHLEVGEWVPVSTGNVNSNAVKETLFKEYIFDRPEVVMVVYDVSNTLGGSNQYYQVVGFIRARILGFNFGTNQDDRFIVYEFLSWHDDCNIQQ